MEHKKHPSFFTVIFVMILCCFLGAVAPPLIRMVVKPPYSLDPLWLAAVRVLFSGIIFSSFATLSKKSRMQIKTYSGSNLRLSLLAGALLALYFYLNGLTLKYTSSFNMMTMICTQFVFIAIFARIFLKQRMTKVALIGIISAFIGIVLIGYGDFTEVGSVFGIFIGFLMSIVFSAYFVCGMVVRREIFVTPYSAVVNVSAALLLLIAAFAINGAPPSYSWTELLIILAIVLSGSILTHSALNWSVKYLSGEVFGIMQLPAPVYALIIMQIFGALGLFKSDTLSIYSLFGSIVIMIGIAIYLYLKAKQEKAAGAAVPAETEPIIEE